MVARLNKQTANRLIALRKQNDYYLSSMMHYARGHIDMVTVAEISVGPNKTMSELTDKEAAVVVLPEAVEEAYRMGYGRFVDAPQDAHGRDLSHYKESARYINHVAPKLRSMAGHADSGMGTYTDTRQVALVEYPDDRPMEAELSDSRTVYRMLVDAWDRGAYDALDDNEQHVPDPAALNA